MSSKKEVAVFIATKTAIAMKVLMAITVVVASLSMIYGFGLMVASGLAPAKSPAVPTTAAATGTTAKLQSLADQMSATMESAINADFAAISSAQGYKQAPKIVLSSDTKQYVRDSVLMWQRRSDVKDGGGDKSGGYGATWSQLLSTQLQWSNTTGSLGTFIGKLSQDGMNTDQLVKSVANGAVSLVKDAQNNGWLVQSNGDTGDPTYRVQKGTLSKTAGRENYYVGVGVGLKEDNGSLKGALMINAGFNNNTVKGWVAIPLNNSNGAVSFGASALGTAVAVTPAKVNGGNKKPTGTAISIKYANVDLYRNPATGHFLVGTAGNVLDVTKIVGNSTVFNNLSNSFTNLFNTDNLGIDTSLDNSFTGGTWVPPDGGIPPGPPPPPGPGEGGDTTHGSSEGTGIYMIQGYYGDDGGYKWTGDGCKDPNGCYCPPCCPGSCGGGIVGSCGKIILCANVESINFITDIIKDNAFVDVLYTIDSDGNVSREIHLNGVIVQSTVIQSFSQNFIDNGISF